MYGFFQFLVVFIFEHLDHELGDSLAFFLLETSGRDSWRSKSDSGRVKGLSGIPSDGIHVERHADFVENRLRFFAGNPQRPENISQNKMVVRATADHSNIVLTQDFRHGS